jgi:hypothetical protein
MKPKLTRIRQLIENAKQHELASPQLNRLLHARAQHLHEAIKLPHAEAEQLLADFVVRYIAQVPEFIEAISEITQEAGIFDGIFPLLNIASDYLRTVC